MDSMASSVEEEKNNLWKRSYLFEWILNLKKLLNIYF